MSKLALTKQEAKARMLEVRSDIKKYVHGRPDEWMKDMAHLGEYPKNMEDAQRTIIALQDLLEKSMERHAEATKHVENDKCVINHANYMIQSVAGRSMMESLMRSEQIGDMNKQIESLKKDNERLVKQATQYADYNSELTIENQKLDAQYRAAMVTLRSSMNEGYIE
ncbi:hypothetical protein SUFG_00051 [Sulfitobacter phage phiCB2047-B]|uniref:Uncharacterized protein n=1 Tax=Sulfitobacter phage phiCB2047-B TaxID=754046 RepID=M4PN03_9CAUD|nr:hypothetical protein SUFG_00051 [Sulfitobacter phage phiCB2047-B]AGH07418.1 hypothetical protein SUFG_00051 [Sulfitobacter phage phiCB2047-B]